MSCIIDSENFGVEVPHDLFSNTETKNDSIQESSHIEDYAYYDVEREQRIQYYSTIPQIVFKKQPFVQQIKGFTVLPNICVRIKNYRILDCNGDFLIVRLVYSQREEVVQVPKEEKKSNYRKRKKIPEFDFSQQQESYIISSTPVRIAYVATEDEAEEGVCLVVDKVSLPKFLQASNTFEYRILITLVRSEQSDWGYERDESIYNKLTDERLHIANNLRGFNKQTTYIFYELAKNITEPFTIVKTVLALSKEMTKTRDDYLKNHPQKGRKKTKFTSLA